ncbi:MAG TPA: type II secretion system F family protein [Gemmatimonadaceae bacterium]
MAIALAVFGAVLAIIVGTYWVAVVRPEEGERQTIRQRMRVPRRMRLLAKLEKDPEKLSAVDWVDALLARWDHLSTPLQALVLQSGLPLTVGVLVLGSIFVGMAAAAAVAVLLPFPGLAAIPVGIVASSIPFFFVKWKARKRLEAFEEQFPEAIDLIARALRAGHALPTALQMVADEIPAPVGEEFKRLFDQHSYGMALPEAMRSFGDRVPLLDARFFVTAILTQREMGGNLSEVLDKLAAVIRERFKVKRQVRVMSAHGRITGVVLGFLPPAVAAVLFIISPRHMDLLFKDPIGLYMVAGAIVLQVVGVLAIRKIVDVEY